MRIIAALAAQHRNVVSAMAMASSVATHAASTAAAPGASAAPTVPPTPRRKPLASAEAPVFGFLPEPPQPANAPAHGPSMPSPSPRGPQLSGWATDDPSFKRSDATAASLKRSVEAGGVAPPVRQPTLPPLAQAPTASPRGATQAVRVF